MQGISIQQLTLPKLKIERFYIKLDKKLIVRAHKIEYKRDSKSKTSVYEINKIISYFKYLNPIFKSISLKNIIYNDEKVNILYKDNIFYVDSKFLTIDANVTQDNKKNIKMNIKQMILKDYQLELKGNLTLDLRDKTYSYDGKFDLLNISGNAKIKINKNLLYYDLNTASFNSLAPVMKYLKSKVFIEPLAREWIYKKIKAKKYKLNYLIGKFNIKTKEFYPLFIKGLATAKDVKIKFNPSVTPAYARTVKVKLENNKLYFNLTKPTYEKKIINVNNLYIYNLLTTKNGIVVDIKSRTLLDKYIHNILKSFKIDIPINQIDGKNSSNLILDIRFKPYSINVKGEFLISHSHFKLLGIPFFTKHAKIRLDNQNVYLKNYNLSYQKLFDIETTGIFKIKKGSYNGKADINSLLISLKNSPILDIKKLKNEPVNIKIGKKENIITFDNLKTKLLFKKGRNKFILKDISKYKKYSNFARQNDIKSGSLIVKTKDFKNYKARLKLYDINTPFIYKKKKIKDLDISIETDGDKIKAFTDDHKISLIYNNKHMILNLNNIDVLVDKNASLTQKNMDISINGKHVNFLFKDFNSTILSENFTLNNIKHEIRFYSTYRDSILKYEQNRSHISIHGKKLTSYFANMALNKNILDGGSIDINIEGISTDMFDGNITIKNSILKNFSLFNNIMATINTIPSLLFLKDPHFNELGYLVKNGHISFKRNGGILSFSKIILHGASADIDGVGYINLKNKKIDMAMRIKTLKDISKIIKNIPLVGYILLGKDKSISTFIKVSGTIDNPKIKTQVLKDTISSPFNIMKRILKAPLKLFQ